MNYSQVRELEAEVIEVGQNLRTMEISETEASEREDQFSGRLNEMQQRYNEVYMLIKVANLLKAFVKYFTRRLVSRKFHCQYVSSFIFVSSQHRQIN